MGSFSQKLLEVLKEFSPEEVFLIESLDPQYEALKKLHSSLGDNELFLKLVLVNALMSYQLPMRGERYWENFSRYFSENPSLDGFEDFIKKYNNRFLNGKLKRLQKVLKVIKPLTKKELIEFCQNPKRLLEYLSTSLRQDKTAKTLVFAVKMFIYACRIATSKPIKAPFDIEIPLDVRLKKISPELEFWRKLSEELGIPPLHLDAVVWLSLGGDKKFLENLPEELKEKILKLRKVLKEMETS
jgi:DNA-(apurinic or apyrimidinic site) lyase